MGTLQAAKSVINDTNLDKQDLAKYTSVALLQSFILSIYNNDIYHLEAVPKILSTQAYAITLLLRIYIYNYICTCLYTVVILVIMFHTILYTIYFGSDYNLIN